MDELSRKAQEFNEAKKQVLKLLPFCFYDDEKNCIMWYSGTLKAISDFLTICGKTIAERSEE